MATSHLQDLPTILLVQGSFQIPEVYQKLTQNLVAGGFPVIHPKLPSISDTESPDFPQRSIVDDAATVRAELTRAIELEGKVVIVVMHSYGGLVGSEAVTEEFSYQTRQARGLAGGVPHLFFYSAFLLNEGQSVLSAFGESPNNDIKVIQVRCCLQKVYSQVILARWPILHLQWCPNPLQRPSIL